MATSASRDALPDIEERARRMPDLIAAPRCLSRTSRYSSICHSPRWTSLPRRGPRAALLQARPSIVCATC
jgi:hypothetical protein